LMDAPVFAPLPHLLVVQWVYGIYPFCLLTIVQCTPGRQRLRLALALAILSKAPFWLLDEPNAALDAKAAEAMQAFLQGLRGTRTLIALTHSSALIARADRAVRVADGMVVPLPARQRSGPAQRAPPSPSGIGCNRCPGCRAGGPLPGIHPWPAAAPPPG